MSAQILSKNHGPLDFWEPTLAPLHLMDVISKPRPLLASRKIRNSLFSHQFPKIDCLPIMATDLTADATSVGDMGCTSLAQNYIGFLICKAANNPLQTFCFSITLLFFIVLSRNCECNELGDFYFKPQYRRRFYNFCVLVFIPEVYSALRITTYCWITAREVWFEETTKGASKSDKNPWS